MGKVTAYTLLGTVSGTTLLYGVNDPSSTPVSGAIEISTLFDALPQPIGEDATPEFARLYLEPSPEFDLASGVLGVGAILAHPSTVTIPASKAYDHIRLSKSSTGGYNVFSIGNGGVVSGFRYEVQAESDSHASSALYGTIGEVSNKGPGIVKSVYGRAISEEGSTGTAIGGVFAVEAREGAVNWVLQLAVTDHTDFVAFIHPDNLDSANLNDGIVYSSDVKMEGGGAFFKAFQTAGHDGDFAHYMTQLGATLFRADKNGVVTAAHALFTGGAVTGLRSQTGSGIVMPHDRVVVGVPAGLDLVTDSANGRGLRIVVDEVITQRDVVIQGIQGTEDGYVVFSARDSLGLVFANPNGAIDFAPSNNRMVQFDGAGVLFINDNSNDIGASGATRPRTGYFGTSVVINGPVNVATFTPSGSADSSGNTGDVRWDSSFIYIKTGAGAWKRAALSTF